MSTTAAADRLLLVGDFNFQVTAGRLLLVCDFNLQVNLRSVNHVISSVIVSKNLTQHVKRSTHKGGHILGLVITREGDRNKVTNISCTPQVLSDHYSLEFKLLVGRPRIS